MVKTSPSNAEGSVPGQEAKIPHAPQPSKKPKHTKRSNTVMNSIKILKMAHMKIT